MIRPQINVSLPTEGPFGWGVCGRQLTAALKEIADVCDLSDPQVKTYLHEKPILHAIEGVTLMPLRPGLRPAARSVGYCFVEDTLLAAKYVRNARSQFDHVATGSSWCTEQLRSAGLEKVSTVIQGIAPEFFEERDPRRADAPFTVFTGGKAEFRKGTDIAAKALGIFLERHPSDTRVTAFWFNPWPRVVMTLLASQVLAMDGCGDASAMFKRLKAQLPADRTEFILGPLMPENVAEVYANSDIGLFPNRCEAGTNLVMMEYMAAAKPVIATYGTGHKDVLLESNPFNLRAGKETLIRDSIGQPTGVWIEPDLEEILANLELAYATRDALASEGAMNHDMMLQFTWERCARQTLELLLKP